MRAQRYSIIVLLLAAIPRGLAGAEAPSFFESAKLTGSDTAAGDEFGHSMEISGETLIVGAWFDDDRGPASGSAYVFKRLAGEGAGWEQTAKLTAPDGVAADFFGAAVRIDGDTALVTASVNDETRLGYAYVFGRDAGGPGAWGPVAKLLAADGVPDDAFAAGGMALDGDTAVVGAPSADLPDRSGGGAVYVFERNAGGPDQWGQVAKLTPATGCSEIPQPAFCGWKDSRFGTSVSIDGDRLVVKATNGAQWDGLAYLFQRDPSMPEGWRRVSRIKPPYREYNFGSPASISGDTLLVGAYGNQDLGAEAGAAYLFEPDPAIPSGWRQIAKIKARDGHQGDWFGASAALSGDTAVVGAPQVGRDWRGQAYVFRPDGGVSAPWRQIAKLVPAGLEPYDVFSRHKVAISGETIVVGAYGDDDRGDSAGAVYVFQETRVDPALAISGSCPGPVTVSATGLTPNGEVEVYRSSSEGSFALPGGPCVGIELGVAEAQLVAQPLRLDGSGGFELTPILPEAACGSYLQLVDLTSCALSGVEPVP